METRYPKQEEIAELLFKIDGDNKKLRFFALAPARDGVKR